MIEEQVRVFYNTDSVSKRLDQFLVKRLPEHSRSRLQNLVKSGMVSVDGVIATKSGIKLDGGEVVEVTIPPTLPSRIIPENIPLDIIFESGDVLVVNKPPNMVVHPSPGHSSGTLANAVLAHAPDIKGIGGERRPGIVHRLDKNTSGLIIVAKNDDAHLILQKQFQSRKVEKTYVALVDGAPPSKFGRVEAPIGRDSTQRQKMGVVSPKKGRDSVSEYRTLESFDRHNLLEIHPITGRTHQIRVHMAFLGCPIVGDKVYGFGSPSLPAERHLLHAKKLRIILPGENDPREFEAPLPDDFINVLEMVRRYI
ncbi:MAG: RluA family pseudouridine synthase [Chloroflexi bacterium]|nr:RluA family pseudouridine synthase [Chloroflexota bacterium]